jgi:hypothetical protein
LFLLEPSETPKLTSLLAEQYNALTLKLVISHLTTTTMTNSYTGVIRMQDNSELVAPGSERTTIGVVTFSLILLALYAPYMVSYQELSESTRYLVTAITWSFIEVSDVLNQSGGTALLLLHPIQAVVLVAFPRLFFVLVINRSLRGKSKPGEFFLASALLVFQLVAPCVFYYFNPFYIELPTDGRLLILRRAPPVGSLICVPAPILLCVGLVILGLWEAKRTAPESES